MFYRFCKSLQRQLPPCSSKAPFIVLPSVTQTFDFRCLRENRRVVQETSRTDEIEAFHNVLSDVSMGEDSNDVREFLVGAYVRGWKAACAEEVEFEGSTEVFTKRRYRDRCSIASCSHISLSYTKSRFILVRHSTHTFKSCYNCITQVESHGRPPRV